MASNFKILDNLENIPEKSLFFVPLRNKESSNDYSEKHSHVIMVTLTNNKNIKEFDNRWIFNLESYMDVFREDNFLKTRLKEIPGHLLQKYTSINTRRDGNPDREQLVCVLSLVVQNDNNNIFYKLCEIINLTVALGFKRIPSFLLYDAVLRDCQQQIKRFWEIHQPDSKYLTQEFQNRRFNKANFKETDSAEIIDQIKVPTREETYNFVEMDEYKSSLKTAMGIEPLPIEEYESVLTHEMVVQTFEQLQFLEKEEEIQSDLLQIFLHSYHLCHLVFSNIPVLKRLKKIYNKYREKLAPSLMYGLYVLYAEELILGAGLNPNYRCVFDLHRASLLPVDDTFHIMNSPYLCLPYMPKALSLHTCLLGLARASHTRTLFLSFSQQEHYTRRAKDKLRKYLCSRGINSRSRIWYNIFNYTYGMLEDLNDPDIFLTGSGAEACIYDNPLFRENGFKFDDIYANREDSSVKHSDIDLVVFTEDHNLLAQKARKVADTISMNLQSNVIVKEVNKYKFRITGEKMLREIDIFMTHKNPASLLYNYHIATCRALISMDDHKSNSCLMTSMVISCHLGLCIDRRWFSSKISLYDRICAQYSRGIGVLMNPSETMMMRQFFELSPKWKYLSVLVNIINRNNKTLIHVENPYLNKTYFLFPKMNKVGSFYESNDKMSSRSSGNINLGSITNYKSSDIVKSRLRNQDGQFIDCWK